MIQKEIPNGDVDSLVDLAKDLDRIEQIKDPADLKVQDAIDNFRTVLNFATDPECPKGALPKIAEHIQLIHHRVHDLLNTVGKGKLVAVRQAA